MYEKPKYILSCDPATDDMFVLVAEMYPGKPIKRMEYKQLKLNFDGEEQNLNPYHITKWI